MLNAQKIGEWELVDLDPIELYQTLERPVLDAAGKPVMIEVPDPEADPPANVKVPKKVKVIQKRRQYTLQLKRQLFVITGFGEEVGETRSTWTFRTSANSIMTYSTIGKKWICTRDHLGIAHLITGEVQQNQTWVHMSKWEDVDDEAF